METQNADSNFLAEFAAKNAAISVFTCTVRNGMSYTVLRRTFYFEMWGYQLNHDTGGYKTQNHGKFTDLAAAVDHIATILKGA